MKKHTTYRGQTIDMELLKFQNQHKVALGNAHMNARGDKIGKGGTVLKTREELLAGEDIDHGGIEIAPDNIAESIHPAMQSQVDSTDAFFDTPIAASGSTSQSDPEPEVKRKPRTTRNKDE